jgi:hypothetical protein
MDRNAREGKMCKEIKLNSELYSCSIGHSKRRRETKEIENLTKLIYHIHLEQDIHKSL